MAIGGADMPVVVSMLNSYSGWATCASGFLLENELLVITGALVGSSGAILSYIMCKAMNRSFFSVIAGGFGQGMNDDAPQDQPDGEIKEISKEKLVKTLKESKRVVIVPGYGMAAAKCQHDIATLCNFLQKRGKKVQFCIHPVAGRLPGHMNVLLAEADVDYNLVKEMDEINECFSDVDVVLIIGANDIVNPDALENPKSPIAGMPVCRVWESKKVVVFKRGKGTGYAGIENPLFFKPGTFMFYGDAAKSVQIMLNALTENAESFGEAMQITEGDENLEDQQENLLDEAFPEPVMTLGVPKEIFNLEKRVAVTPSTVKKFRSLGFQVLVESSAGDLATYTDEQYEQQGAKVVSTSEVWNCDVVVAVRKPDPIDCVSSSTRCLISYVQPASCPDWLSEAASKSGLSVLAMDCVPRITKAQKLDSLSSMANIGGYRAVMEAFQYFQKCPKPMMTAAGKLPPAQVLIMGAGVAGLSAIGYCKSLGCVVKAIDSRSAAKSDAESMGAKFLQVKVKEEGGTTTGYAKEMSEDYKKAQAELILNASKSADIIITTALIPGRPAPRLISEKVVLSMKPGSVIVDMAAENGGNCELTRKDEVFISPNGVVIVGFTDLVSRMAPQSSELYANNLFHLLSDMGGAGEFKVNQSDEIIQSMCVVHEGKVTWSPTKPLPPVSAKPEAITAEVLRPKDSPSFWKEFDYIFIAVLLILLFLGISFATYSSFMSLIMTFVLALFIGFMVIWNVSPALHTPLMSVTNAISGIIVVGAMLCLEPEDDPVDFGSALGILSVLFTSINIWGGFIVTYRMLQMFKTRMTEEKH
jgi:NAD(P) transhydrogenase